MRNKSQTRKPSVPDFHRRVANMLKPNQRPINFFDQQVCFWDRHQPAPDAAEQLVPDPAFQIRDQPAHSRLRNTKVAGSFRCGARQHDSAKGFNLFESERQDGTPSVHVVPEYIITKLYAFIILIIC